MMNGNTRKIHFLTGKQSRNSIVNGVIILIILSVSIVYIGSYLGIYYVERTESREIDTLLKDWTNEYKENKDNIELSNATYSLEKGVAQKDNSGNEERLDITYAPINGDIESADNGNLDQKDDAKSNDKIKADCILMIPSIDLKKYVYNGSQREVHLEQYELVTATHDMEYQNGGNYIICGHYSKLYGHSLNRLKEISVDDEVTIWKDSVKTQYRVSSVSYINMNNTTQYCNQTNNKQITIVSCAKYIGEDKYIVVKCECMN